MTRDERQVTIQQHIRAIVLLPAVATLVVPAVILYLTRSANAGWSLAPPFHLAPIVAGILLAGLGLTLMVKTVSLFATVGQGTLAPWNPTRRLVVRGIYRHVRNPMISGVVGILLGEAVALGSIPLAVWCGTFAIVNLVYMPLFEEPGLERRFGEDYLRYKHNVPRWIPRFEPWDPH
jgi:protein-S-isoprenylcysteine O-methyltransferase Ste14